MSGRLKKFISLTIISAMLVSLISTVYSQPLDIAGSKDAGTINKWLSKGLTALQKDGTFKPNEPLKRNEFFGMINKVFHFTEKASISFSDVIKGSACFNDISRAVAAGYLHGDKQNKVYPFALINRLDAAVILAKVFEIQSNGKDEVDTLADADRIPADYREAVNVMLQNSFMGVQEGNKFNPYGNITRANGIVLIDKIMGELYNKSGSYTGGMKNSVVINTGSVNLKGITILGNLYLTEGIGSGTVTFDSVNVKGKIIIHGGNNVTFKNSSASGNVIIDKKDGKIRLTTDGYSSFPTAMLYSGAVLDNSSSWISGFRNVKVAASKYGQQLVLNGNYDSISVEASDARMQLSGNANKLQAIGTAAGSNIGIAGGVVSKFDIQAPRTVANLNSGNITELDTDQNAAAAKIIIDGSRVGVLEPNAGMFLDIRSGSVNTLNLQKGSEGSIVQVAKTGSIGTVCAYAGATFKGQGAISYASIYSNGVSMEQQPGAFTIQSGLVASIGNSRNPATTLSIRAEDMTIQKGSTIPSVVTVIPSDATLSYSSSDKTVAAVDSASGLITGVGAGTATVVVTGSRSGYFNSSASFTVTVSSEEPVISGTLAMDVNSAVVASVKTITLKYVPGEASSNGTFNFILPAGFSATSSDTVNIAGTGAVTLNANQILNGGQTVSITGATLGTNQSIILVLKDKTIPAAGFYNFKVTADSDGQGPKASSAGTGMECVQFESVARSLLWSSATFNEASSNDGSISTVINLTLTNETFTGGPFISGTHYTVTNVPAGLTVQVNRTGANTATITLTGSAASHTAADSISNLGITFTNAAFTSGNASIVTNSAKTGLTVHFNDPAAST